MKKRFLSLLLAGMVTLLPTKVFASGGTIFDLYPDLDMQSLADSVDPVYNCDACNALATVSVYYPPGRVAATCIESGYSGDRWCFACLAATQGCEISALGHDFVDGKCTRCDEIEILQDDSGKNDVDISWEFDAQHGLLTISAPYYSNDPGDICWNPEYRVILQDEPWAKYKNGVREVTISGSVEYIGDAAFSQYPLLEKVTFSPQVHTIGRSAFSGCEKLSTVSFPKTLNYIEAYAFYGCNSLRSISVDAAVGDYAFAYCKNLESLSVYGNIGAHAFEGCEKLHAPSVYHCSKIGNSAFYRCKNMKYFFISGNMQEIAANAFSYCESLESFAIPEGVFYVKPRTFYGCSSLKSVTLPQSLNGIDYGAFEGCALNTITIPAKVSSISLYDAFMGCPFPYGIWVDENNAVYSSDEHGVLFDKHKTQLLLYPDSYPGPYVIPETVSTIGYCAFASARKLVGVTMPKGLKNIADSAFCGCESLAELTLPDGVESIGYTAFAHCDALKSVTIPGSVNEIRGFAFYDCLGLTQAELAEGVSGVAYSVFSQCKNLERVSIPQSLKTVREGTFFGCAALTDVCYSGTQAQWDEMTVEAKNEPLLLARIHFNGWLPDEQLDAQMSISVGAEMTVGYSIMPRDVAKYEDFYLVVEKEGADGKTVSTTYAKTTKKSDHHKPLTVSCHLETGEVLMYGATYDAVSAKEMGDTFKTTLFGVDADGKIYYNTIDTMSMKEYLLAMLQKETARDAQKTMVVDMLKYGEAAQRYFDYGTENLITDDLTEAELSHATAEIPTAVDISAVTGEGANIIPSVTIGASVELGLSMLKTGETKAVRCEVRDMDGRLLAEPPVTASVIFSAIYDDAWQMRKPITVAFFDGETQISKTLTWSIESFVAQCRARGDARQMDMVNAMLIYGDSVSAYLAEIGQQYDSVSKNR